MAQGFKFQMSRVDVMRVLAERVRTKTAEFEKLKSEHKAQVAKDKQALVAELHKLWVAARASKNPEELSKLHEVKYETRKTWFRPGPTLNVCQEKHYLNTLKLDKREELSILSTTELGLILQGDCEVQRG